MLIPLVYLMMRGCDIGLVESMSYYLQVDTLCYQKAAQLRYACWPCVIASHNE